MTTIKPASQSLQTIDAQLKEVLTHFPKISFAMLFGSVAAGRQRAEGMDREVIEQKLAQPLSCTACGNPIRRPTGDCTFLLFFLPYLAR